MKKIMVIIVSMVLLCSSYTLMARPVNIPGRAVERNLDAPGQLRKTNQYVNQVEFVFSVLTRNLNRIQDKRDFTPPGLMMLTNLLEQLINGVDDDDLRDFTIVPGNDYYLSVNDTIVIEAEGADDLRIMLWAKQLDNISAAKDAYYDDERVFSARLTTLINGGLTATMDEGMFTIVVNDELIGILEAGVKYGAAGSVEYDMYQWNAGNATSWIFTPETNNTLWAEYNTWDGEKVDDTFRVYCLG